MFGVELDLEERVIFLFSLDLRMTRRLLPQGWQSLTIIVGNDLLFEFSQQHK